MSRYIFLILFSNCIQAFISLFLCKGGKKCSEQVIVGVCRELHVKSGGAMSNDFIVGFLNLEILVDKISA